MLEIERVKKEIVRKLKPFGPTKIILFGSYAYGEPTEESDLDICVIRKKIESKTKLKRAIREALKDIRAPKDIVVEEEAYFLSHSDERWINTALYDARHKGELLYG